MSKAKPYTTQCGPWTINFTRDPDADGFIARCEMGDFVLEWCYPKVPGITSLAAGAVFWREQARIQAEGEWWKERGGKFKIGDPVVVRDLDRWLPNFVVTEIKGEKMTVRYQTGDGPVAARVADIEFPVLAGSTRFDFDSKISR